MPVGGAPKQERRRPLGVVVLAVMELLNGALVLFDLADDDLTFTFRVLPDAVAPAVPFVALALALGLWRLYRWAWTLMMLWTGLLLALDLIGYLQGHPAYSTMLISVIIVFYLNQREVQDAFRRAGPRRGVDSPA